MAGRKRVVGKADPNLSFAPKDGVWLSVCRSPTVERAATSWWCLPKAALVGDWLVFYEVRKGLSRIERVTSAPHRREERCSESGLLTVDTAVVADLERPVTFMELRENYALSDMQAVRRSFQGTAFAVEPVHFKPLEKALIKAGLRRAVWPCVQHLAFLVAGPGRQTTKDSASGGGGRSGS